MIGAILAESFEKVRQGGELQGEIPGSLAVKGEPDRRLLLRQVQTEGVAEPAGNDQIAGGPVRDRLAGQLVAGLARLAVG